MGYVTGFGGEGECPVSGTDGLGHTVWNDGAFPGRAQARALLPRAVVRLEIQLTSYRHAM